MSGFRVFDVADDALREARGLGMFGNVRARLQKMARSSTPFTHPNGNRRFEGFLLTIEGHTVLGVAPYRVPTPGVPLPTKKKKKVHTMILEAPKDDGMVVCPDCNADGGPCATCNSTGKLLKDVADSLTMNAYPKSYG